jgi:hypothetical protein
MLTVFIPAVERMLEKERIFYKELDDKYMSDQVPPAGEEAGLLLSMLVESCRAINHYEDRLTEYKQYIS